MNNGIRAICGGKMSRRQRAYVGHHNRSYILSLLSAQCWWKVCTNARYEWSVHVYDKMSLAWRLFSIPTYICCGAPWLQWLTPKTDCPWAHTAQRYVDRPKKKTKIKKKEQWEKNNGEGNKSAKDIYVKGRYQTICIPELMQHCSIFLGANNLGQKDPLR